MNFRSYHRVNLSCKKGNLDDELLKALGENKFNFIKKINFFKTYFLNKNLNR